MALESNCPVLVQSFTIELFVLSRWSYVVFVVKLSMFVIT